MDLNINCCDGIYNSFDVHFTGLCDNKCVHCIDMRFAGLGANKPNVDAIAETIINNKDGLDDVLFLGGEPCLYLDELLECVKILKEQTKLKLFVTTAVPKVCFDKQDVFFNLISLLDGINLSTQHHDEVVADQIRMVVSQYDRQAFYASLPNKHKIRINLNIVKPYLHTKQDISDCLKHYSDLGFRDIKLSEIQHGEDVYVSFSEVFNIQMDSAYANGCQTYLNLKELLSDVAAKVLLKRSCFICEESLAASFSDGLKVIVKIFQSSKNKYGVVYGDGTLKKGWV